MPMQTEQPVIVIRRTKGHGGGHRGGAWKVAYADFVTAMLALFIVLWLSSSSDQVQKAVGGYFADPKGLGKSVGNGLRGSGSESLSVRKDDMSKLKEKLEQAVKDATSLQKIKEHVIFSVTSEGLRVELVEGENSTFFESANSRPTEFGKELLKRLAEEVGKLPNRVTMEGHTDSRPYRGNSDYSNWELSADRANSARRWMQENGLREDQVTQVRGFAAQSLRDPANPTDGKNRRVTMIIMYQAAKPQFALKDLPPDVASPSSPSGVPKEKPEAAPAPAASPATKAPPAATQSSRPPSPGKSPFPPLPQPSKR